MRRQNAGGRYLAAALIAGSFVVTERAAITVGGIASGRTERASIASKKLFSGTVEIVAYLEVRDNYLHEGHNHETHHNRISLGVRALGYGRPCKPGSS
jgi:hypothetical protein